MSAPVGGVANRFRTTPRGAIGTGRIKAGDCQVSPQKGNSSMSTEENKALVRRQFEAIWNGGNLALIDELYAPNYTNHDPANPDQAPGPAGFTQRVGLYRTALPDLHLTVEDQVAEDDRVVTRWTASGTHQGDLMGIPPTGKSVSVTGMLISRIESGKFVEEWVNWDTLGLLRQVGAVPEPAPVAAAAAR